MSEQETLLEFPCQFPIKVMGKNQADFDHSIMDLIKPHVERLDKSQVRVKSSKGGKYLAVTVTIQADSKAQLDAIYQDLSASSLVIMAL